jgi:hypothetical protein
MMADQTEKKPITLQDIQVMWAADTKINELDLGREALKISELHAKYLNMLTATKMQSRRAYGKMLQYRRLKERYFLGLLSKDELASLGWEPYLFAKPLKAELDKILDADTDVLQEGDKVAYLDTMVYQLEQIMRSLNSRTFDVKNAIQFFLWQQGN